MKRLRSIGAGALSLAMLLALASADQAGFLASHLDRRRIGEAPPPPQLSDD